MLIGILLLAAVIFAVYKFKQKNPGITVEQESEELLAKAEAGGQKFVAYTEDELSKIEGEVSTEAKDVVADLKKFV